MKRLKVETREKLKTVSTATLATALFKRGLRNQMIQDVHPLNPGGAPMVGEAYTLRYIPAREDLNTIGVFSIVPIRSGRRWRNAPKGRYSSSTAGRTHAPRRPAPSWSPA